VNSEKYIGLDVHQATISAAVLDSSGKLVMESIVETKAATKLGKTGAGLLSWGGCSNKANSVHVSISRKATERGISVPLESAFWSTSPGALNPTAPI
jgi:hypothetical protein